ncbi:MAG TPA: multidrug ABC transporter ATP-binding protein, partial [Anaerolineae bacterium]|nr:multidrug ABC transporter ATP-binding protein [Anaerolineae bacterium]
RVQLREVTPEILAAVRALPFVTAVTEAPQGLRVALDEPETHNPELIQALMTAGAAIQFVERESHSLEQVYFDLLHESEATA